MADYTILNMRLKKRYFAAFLLGIAAPLCQGQTNAPQTDTNWGASVSNVQMSIGLTNHLLSAASDWTLQARIRNSSTNMIFFRFMFQPVYEFDLELIDATGKSHSVRPNDPGHSGGGSFVANINPGETNTTDILVWNWIRDLKPGNYTLRASKDLLVLVDDGTRKTEVKQRLVSNSLEVRIKEFK